MGSPWRGRWAPGWWGLGPRRGVFVLGIAVVVAVVVAVLAAVAVVRLAGSSPPAAAQDRPGTVLLVPGYGGEQGALAVLAERLRVTGRAVVVVVPPGDGTGDLAGQATALDSAAEQVLDAGAPSVDVVGYSAGGVVARLWVAREDTARAARRVVTLGAPLHGARIAAAGTGLVPGACPRACQQLAPGSALLRELDATPLPAALPWVSLWTADDETVVPPESARLPGAVNVEVQQVCPDARVAHGQLPTDPLVTGIVLRALGPVPMQAPGPADCAALRAVGTRTAAGTP